MAKEIVTADEAYRRACVAACEYTRWNISQASELLEMDRRTLHRNLDRWGYTGAVRMLLRTEAERV